MHRAFLIAAVSCGLFVMAPRSWGADPVTVNLSMLNGAGIGDSAGVDLVQTSLIRVGTFLISDALIAANYNNLLFLSSNFVEFGTLTVGGGGYGVDGYGGGDITADPTVINGAGGNIQGDRIFLWIFNSSSMATASEHGVFYSTNANWIFPTSDPGPLDASTAVDIAEVPTSGVGLVIGSYGLGTTDAFGEPMYNLAVIPEPTGLIAILGSTAFPLLRRKRRATT